MTKKKEEKESITFDREGRRRWNQSEEYGSECGGKERGSEGQVKRGGVVR